MGTSHLANGLHTLSIELFSSRDLRTEIGSDGDDGRHVALKIDNLWPVARIQTIRHEGGAVPACAIVHGLCDEDELPFCVTASDGDGHLMGWQLTALWGDGESMPVDSDQYAPPGPLWYGRSCDPANPAPDVPSPPWEAYVPGSQTAARCAYTFALTASDRAIDGYRYIHSASHHRSLTIDLSGCP